MTRKIVSEFALGVVLLVAIAIGGIFLWQNEKDSQQAAVAVAEKPLPEKSANSAKVGDVQIVASSECKAHYYEGETQVNAWISDSVGEENTGSIMISIGKQDISALPIANDATYKNQESDIRLKLVDASASVMDKLKKATKEKPVSITIKGFGKICGEPPLVASIQPATIAFKKS